MERILDDKKKWLNYNYRTTNLKQIQKNNDKIFKEIEKNTQTNIKNGLFVGNNYGEKKLNEIKNLAQNQLGKELTNEQLTEIIQIENNRIESLNTTIEQLYENSVNYILSEYPDIPKFLSGKNFILNNFYYTTGGFFKDLVKIVLSLVKEKVEEFEKKYNEKLLNAIKENNFNYETILFDYKVELLDKIENNIGYFFENIILDKDLMFYFLSRKGLLYGEQKFTYLHNFYYDEENLDYFEKNFKMKEISNHNDFIVFYNDNKKNFLFFLNEKDIKTKTIEKIGQLYAFFKEQYNVSNQNFYFSYLKNEDFLELIEKENVLNQRDITSLNNIITLPLKQYFLNALLNNCGDFTAYFIEDEKFQFNSFGMESKTKYGNVYKELFNHKNEYYNANFFLEDLRNLFDFQLDGISTIENVSIGTVKFRLSVLVKNQKYYSVSIRTTSSIDDFYVENDFKRFNVSTSITLEDGTEIDLIKTPKELEEETRFVDHNKKEIEKHNKLGFGSSDKKELSLSNFLNKEDEEKFKNLVEKGNGVGLVCGETGSGKSTFLKTLYGNYIVQNSFSKNFFKKIFFIEGPIEGSDYNLYKLPYEVDSPNDLKTMVFNLKTQKPNISVIGETKNADTLDKVYELGGISQTATTLHTADIKSFLNITLSDYSNNIDDIPSKLDSTNYIFIQKMLSKTKQPLTGNLKTNKEKLDYLKPLFYNNPKEMLHNNNITENLNETKRQEIISENKEKIKKLKNNIKKLVNEKNLNIFHIETITNKEREKILNKNKNNKQVYIHYELFLEDGIKNFLNNLPERSYKAIQNKAGIWWKYGGIKNTFDYKTILAYLKGEVLPEENTAQTLYGNYIASYENIQKSNLDKKLAITEQLLNDLSDLK